MYTSDLHQQVSDILPEDSKYLEAMKKFAGGSTFFSQMVHLVSAESTLSAICHGDCWVNNFLYRYEYTGDNTEQKKAVDVRDFPMLFTVLLLFI